jgi:hypothetical protein
MAATYLERMYRFRKASLQSSLDGEPYLKSVRSCIASKSQNLQLRFLHNWLGFNLLHPREIFRSTWSEDQSFCLQAEPNTSFGTKRRKVLSELKLNMGSTSPQAITYIRVE